MPTVEVMIGNRSYELVCGEGQESRLRSIAQVVDEQYTAIAKSLENPNDRMVLVLTALTLQDEINELKGEGKTLATKAVADDIAIAETINTFAMYIEDLTEKIENGKIQTDAKKLEHAEA